MNTDLTTLKVDDKEKNNDKFYKKGQILKRIIAVKGSA